jgi:hypothetical protein
MADNATEFSIEYDAGPEIWVKHRASGHVSNCRRRPEPLARATSKTKHLLGGFPSYVELVVCIEMMSDSRVHQAEERATNAKSKHHEREKEHDDETAAEGRRLEKALEIGLEDTFPASDAVAVVQPGPP